MTIPTLLVRVGPDVVPVIAGQAEDGSLVGYDLARERVIPFEASDVEGAISTDPAAVFYGMRAEVAEQAYGMAAEASGEHYVLDQDASGSVVNRNRANVTLPYEAIAKRFGPGQDETDFQGPKDRASWTFRGGDGRLFKVYDRKYGLQDAMGCDLTGHFRGPEHTWLVHGPDRISAERFAAWFEREVYGHPYRGAVESAPSETTKQTYGMAAEARAPEDLNEAERAALRDASGGAMNPWKHSSSAVGRLKKLGLIEGYKDAGRTLYKLTDAGRARTGSTAHESRRLVRECPCASEDRSGIVWRRENEGLYRAFVNGSPTEYTAERNDNEPAASPIRWQLLYKTEWPPRHEAWSRAELSKKLALILSKRGAREDRTEPYSRRKTGPKRTGWRNSDLISVEEFAATFLANVESDGDPYEFQRDPRVAKLAGTLDALGVKDVGKVLGAGTFGTAAILDDDHVIKLTTDPSEVQAGHVLRGKDLTHVAHVDGSWFVRGVRAYATIAVLEDEPVQKQYPCGILILERVKTPNDSETRELSKIVGEFKKATNTWPDQLAKLTRERQRTKLRQASIDLQHLLEATGSELRNEDRVEEAYLAEGVASALEELRDEGVYAIDVHGGNVGYSEDEYGERTYKVFDIGSSSPPAKPKARRIDKTDAPNMEQLSFPGMLGEASEQAPWIGGGRDEWEGASEARSDEAASDIRLAASAASVIDTDVLDGRDDEHDPPSFAVLREHYNAGRITRPSTHAAAMALYEALTELANTYDDESLRDGADASEKAFARSAQKGLSTAASKALRHAESLRTWSVQESASRWKIYEPLSKAQILGGAYLVRDDGKYVIFARRHRKGDKGYREYVIHYSTVEYEIDYKTGGANRTLYDGTSLDKAKAAVGDGTAEDRAKPTRLPTSFAPQGYKFAPMPSPLFGGDPILTGFTEVRPQLLKHRSEVPSIETIQLSTVFAGSTVHTGIATAEKAFKCIVTMYERQGRRLPALADIDACLTPLGLIVGRRKMYESVAAWAPSVHEAMASGLRDRELRRHLYFKTELPEHIALAKLSFTLALLGQDCCCLDARLLNRMFGQDEGNHLAHEFGRPPREAVIARYEAVEDAFLDNNPFYRKDDPVGRARAQWMSWESVGGQPATHSVWLNVVRSV